MFPFAMRTSLKFLLICLVLLLGSCRDPMEHARCDDTELKRVPSPDGKLVIVIYNRSCSAGSGLYTYAEVEEPTNRIIWPPGRHPEVCFLVTLAGGYHQLDARWIDSKQIVVSSTDDLNANGSVSSQHDTCNDMAVKYDFHFKPPPLQQAPDQQTVDAIRTAINQSAGCIREKIDSEHVDHLLSLVDDKQHRQALELLFTNLWIAKCPISRETYALLEQAATKMSIDARDLELVKPLVR